ncbi:2-dehydropantoate 2-reductase [Jeotgalibacillus aurantiacus]|uniref:2-dehydropantoate 2-reductase n=1 Tax=Jeotgalibacillus aurantiacus TaxID=2763266 RepID=UPI001D0B232D|nr:2-dehydropantoate 2-reductase [Jeotgalibacillus aurantiacus]
MKIIVGICPAKNHLLSWFFDKMGKKKVIMMNLAVIGGGAIGLLLAANLAKGGFSVTVITRTTEQAEELSINGIGIDSKRIKVNAQTAEQYDFDKADAVIVTVKQYHLAELVPLLQKIDKECPLFFIQNGMSHLSLLDQFPHQSIFVGTIEHGVSKSSRSDIHHNGIGPWKVAPFRGELSKAAFLENIQSANFPIEFDQDYQTLMTVKLIKNIMINPFTALYKVKNGALITNPYLRKNMQALYEEIRLVFPDFISFCSFDDIEQLCEKTANNQSSMLLDILNGRKTEIESLTGFAIRRAELNRIAVPILSLLHNSILSMEYREENQ